jgi:leucyl-tRNA synthetase
MGEYRFWEIEAKWQKYWCDNQSFKTESDTTQKKIYCLDMFPYPSGAGLHLGHPVGYTASDIYSRFKRMQGFNVLHPMGWDAFGLPAEQHAIATGEHPGKLTDENCARFKEQMNSLGLSFDWSREISTCKVDYYHWTQWIFLKLYNSWFDQVQNRARPIEDLEIPEEIAREGELEIESYRATYRLAYYTDAMVNWCPALGTVLANEEVIDGKSERGGFDVIRKPMKQWMLRITKYAERLLSELDGLDWPESIKEQQRNWIGKKSGAQVVFKIKGSSSTIEVFTTRADTIFGVTFLVISPEHPLVHLVTTAAQREKVTAYQEEALRLSDFARTLDSRKKTGVFTGGFAENPISGEQIPLYIADYVVMSYATGAVMGVPAHDERDFDFARTHNLDIRAVLRPKDESDPRGASIIEGEEVWCEAGTMLECNLPVAVELAISGLDNREAGERIIAWLEKNQSGKRIIQYKLRDWLFSRQRYWGEPIPVIHWEDGLTAALTENELPLELPDVKEYKPSESGESPLARAEEWLTVVDAKTGKRGRRETNTMPQWAGSCWYYLRFIDPHNIKQPCTLQQPWDKQLEKAFMPVDLYIGGAEHAVLHLLYSRFWHKVLFDLGYVSTREPFQKLVNQGMLLAHAYQDARGVLIPVDEVEEQGEGTFVHTKSGEKVSRIIAKMSKSLRNVVTPDQIITQYGADTLRLYIMFMGPLDSSRIYDAQAVNGVHRFLRRVYLWSISKEGGDNKEAIREFVAPENEPRSVRQEVHRAIKKVTEDYENLRFNTAISTLMECLNKIEREPIACETFKKYILLLAPMASHLAEEVWEKIGEKQSLVKATFPSYDPVMIALDKISIVLQVTGKKRGLIEVEPDVSEEKLKDLAVTTLSQTAFKVKISDRFIFVRNQNDQTIKLINILRDND